MTATCIHDPIGTEHGFEYAGGFKQLVRTSPVAAGPDKAKYGSGPAELIGSTRRARTNGRLQQPELGAALDKALSASFLNQDGFSSPPVTKGP